MIQILSQQFAEAIRFQRQVDQYSAALAAAMVDQYARRSGGSSPELFDDDGQARWITVGGEKDAQGHRHGGHPVKIDKHGKMLTGNFAGQTLGEAFGSNHRADQTAKQSGIKVEARDNDAAKSGDQMGLFGSVSNVPQGKAALDKTGESKGKQMSMFDTAGDPDQMLMFDDGVTPKDRLMPEAHAAALDQPATPAEQSVGLFNQAIDKGDTPRAAASTAQKKLDEDYEFARASDVRNAGEDLKGSARHKVNAWRGLEQAERDGTAAKLVTRDSLAKLEPHDFMSTAEKKPFLSLAMHYCLKSFPPKPGTANGSPEKNRKEYLEAYRDIKDKATELVQKHDDGGTFDAMNELKRFVSNRISQLRGQRASDSISIATATDRHNQTANDLVNFANNLGQYSRNKTSPVGRLNEFAKEFQNKYGKSVFAMRSESTDEKRKFVEAAQRHAQDLIEGKSVNDSFGKDKKKVRRFDPSEVYVKHATRTGGRDLGSLTADPNKATQHMVESMGLRGVQWGNSVTDDERKHHAAKALEALTDLADVTGLHPRDIALDGKLGLAIGARGKGNASAHYEPGNQVINLTRASGVGALAHEWGHGFDHMLNDFRIVRDPTSDRSEGRYLSNDHEYTHELVDPQGRTWNATGRETKLREGYQLREKPKGEIRRAYRAWWEASKPYRDRLKVVLRDEVRQGSMSAEKANQYWNSDHEIFARTFERHVQHKLNEAGRENTYLAGLGGEHPLWPSNEEAQQMADAFDGILAAYRQHKYGAADPVKYSRREAANLFIPLLIDFYVAGAENDPLALAPDLTMVDIYEWVASQHPRNAAGSPGGVGGQFRSTKLRELPDTGTLRGVDQSHELHHSKLPPHLQKQALNWSAELHRLVGQPMSTKYEEQLARDAGRQLTPDQVQQLKEQRWKSIDKQAVRELLDQMNRMDKQARVHGIDLASHINASRLIPPELAMRLSGGRRFFDPARRGSAQSASVAQPPLRSQPAFRSWKEDPAMLAEYERRKGLLPSQAKPSSGYDSRIASVMQRRDPEAISQQPINTASTSTSGLGKLAAGKVDRAAADTVGDGDKSKIEHFKGLIMDAWRHARQQAQEHNDALRALQGLAGGKTFSARLSQGLARGGDTANVPGFDEVVDHARRNFPHLVGGEDAAESGVVDLFRRGIQAVPQPWHDEVVDQAVKMAPRGFFDEYVPTAAHQPADEPVPFSVIADCRHFVQCYWLREIRDCCWLRSSPNCEIGSVTHGNNYLSPGRVQGDN